jgi:hypothetical protein
MKQIKLALLALTAIFAVSAFGASAAQAAQGPYYKVGGARLLEGESKEVKAKAAEPYVLKAGTISIECKKQGLKAGAKILGSTGKEPGKSAEFVEFSECTVTGNGAGCKVEEPIVTKEVESDLGYETAARTGKIYVWFDPSEDFAEFVKLNFPTASCEVKATSVTGSICGEAWTGGAAGNAITVGAEPAEAKVGEVKFPAVAIKKCFVEETVGGVTTVTDEKPALKAFGVAATLQGRSEQTLVGEPVWGVFTP